MRRADEQMGFLLRYENVAWYEDGKVKILDRSCLLYTSPSPRDCS